MSPSSPSSTGVGDEDWGQSKTRERVSGAGRLDLPKWRVEQANQHNPAKARALCSSRADHRPLAHKLESHLHCGHFLDTKGKPPAPGGRTRVLSLPT